MRMDPFDAGSIVWSSCWEHSAIACSSWSRCSDEAWEAWSGLPIIQMRQGRCLGIDYESLHLCQNVILHHFTIFCAVWLPSPFCFERLPSMLTVTESRPTSCLFHLRLLPLALNSRNGNTALDMGDTTSAQAIRQARDQRVAKQQVTTDHAQKKPKAKAAPNLLALANAGRARSSKGSGRGTRR